jgi:hypothetical protein
MTKKIKFVPRNPQFEILKPGPATKFIPTWFRKMKPVGLDMVITAKRCVPFLDSLSMGYIMPLPADVVFHQDKNEFSTSALSDIVSSHTYEQTSGIETDTIYDPKPWKWLNYFYIKTPKGYSTLFIHPLNRDDLPFHSFSAVVDTDKHPLITNFPFLMKKDFNGVIPAGTPLIQMIPFKRDEWSMSVANTDKPYEYPKEYEVMSSPLGWYRHKWWVKKKYN